MASYDQRLLDLAMKNRKGIERFNRWRPSVERSYDDLIGDIKSGELNVNWIPEDEWEAYASEQYPDREVKDLPGGWYQYSDESIHVPDSEFGREEALPHELMHYFGAHVPGQYSVPEINKYQQLDMKLGGWLPSFHPGGRRPELPGYTKLGQWWNDNMATKNVDYSNRKGYHPWFDEHAFDTALGGHGDHGHDDDHGNNKTDRRNKMANRYTDDEGLFQGGKYGRKFGRLKDWWEENTQDTLGNRDRRQREEFADRMGYEGDIPTTGEYTQYNKEEYYTPEQQKYQKMFGDKYESDPFYRQTSEKKSFDVDQDFMMARDYALDFDVNDPAQVRILQKRLNLVGDLGVEPLDEDGVMGPKTQAALEKLQSMAQRNPGQKFGYERTPDAPDYLTSPEDMETRLQEDRGSLLNRYTGLEGTMDFATLPWHKKKELMDMGYNPFRFGGQEAMSEYERNKRDSHRRLEKIKDEADYGEHWTGQKVTRGYHEAPAHKKAADWLLGPLYDL